jgi:hypothetical protein
MGAIISQDRKVSSFFFSKFEILRRQKPVLSKVEGNTGSSE